MSGSESSLRGEASSTFIKQLDSKIKAYRQELEAVKEYTQIQKGLPNENSEIPKTPRASPSALSESFEKLTLNEARASCFEGALENGHLLIPGSSLQRQSRPHSNRPLSAGNRDIGLCLEVEDTEEIDPIYLQPCNEFTEQLEDGEYNLDDNDSLCNSVQYSEHTHIFDVEPPAFSVYGDESVYDSPLSDSTVTRRGLYQGQLSNRNYDSARFASKNFKDTIYEETYLDSNRTSMPSSETSKYRFNLQKSVHPPQRLEPRHCIPFSNDENEESELFQDDADSLSSRRSSTQYDSGYQRVRKTEYDYHNRNICYDSMKGSSLDGQYAHEERKRIESDLSRDLYNTDSYREREYPRFDNSSLGQSYSLRDDVSSREGSVDASVRYSPRLEEHTLGRRSLINAPMPSSPNLRFQSNRYSSFDRCDGEILRRSRSNISDILSNSARSPLTSPRDIGCRISPVLPDVRRITRAHSPSVSLSHSARNLISERANRRNRYTISNPGDLRSEHRNDFRSSSRLSMGAHSVHPPLSDTTSHSAGADIRSRKLNEVKFEIFRAIHRVKLALDSLVEDSRARSITSEIQGIQDLNELALQTMIEQFEHVHEMSGEGEGSVGARRPISPLSDESYGKLIPSDIKKFGIVEESNYGRQGFSEETHTSGSAKSNGSSPNLYSHRLGHNSRFDRSAFTEPPLSPSPSRISKWQSLIEDSKNLGLLGSRLRSTTFDR